MRSILLITGLIFSIHASSQNEGGKHFGLLVGGSVNLMNGDFMAIRPCLSYNVNKYQFIVGPVISRLVDLEKTSYGRSTAFSWRITGVTLGGKYYINSSKKGGVYYFIDNVLLRYTTYEKLEYSYYDKTKLQIVPTASPSKLLMVQSIVGSGVEARFFRRMRFSLDFGLGFFYNHFRYEESYYNDIYPTSLTKFTLQLRTSVGFVL